MCIKYDHVVNVVYGTPIVKKFNEVCETGSGANSIKKKENAQAQPNYIRKPIPIYSALFHRVGPDCSPRTFKAVLIDIPPS